MWILILVFEGGIKQIGAELKISGEINMGILAAKLRTYHIKQLFAAQLGVVAKPSALEYSIIAFETVVGDRGLRAGALVPMIHGSIVEPGFLHIRDTKIGWKER